MNMAWAGLILRLLLLAICSAGGYFIAYHIERLSEFAWAPWAGLVAGIFFAMIALSIVKIIKRIPLKVLFGGTIGLVVGLSIARLIGYGFSGLENTTVRIAIFIILSCIFGYIGMVWEASRWKNFASPTGAGSDAQPDVLGSIRSLTPV